METIVGACGFRCLFSDKAWTNGLSGVGVAQGGAFGSRGRGDSGRCEGGGFLRASWKSVRGGRMSGMGRDGGTAGSGDPDMVDFGLVDSGSGGGGGDGQ